MKEAPTELLFALSALFLVIGIWVFVEVSGIFAPEPPPSHLHQLSNIEFEGWDDITRYWCGDCGAVRYNHGSITNWLVPRGGL